MTMITTRRVAGNGKYLATEIIASGFQAITGHRDVGLAFSIYVKRSDSGTHAYVAVRDDHTGWTNISLLTADDAARRSRG